LEDDKNSAPVSGATILTISIATWNNCDLVSACLRSIENSLSPDESVERTEVYVVDNASTDGTAETIHSRFPSVRLICNDRPMGFSANHNQVLRCAKGRYVLLLNDDTVVVGNALARAVRFMEIHPEAGAVGCTLVKPDGTPERISQRFPHPLDPIFPSLRRKIDPRSEAANRAEAVEVDRLSGACLMVRREILDQVGLLDERFDPAYGEDTDLCYRIKKAGWRIYRLPGARVIHHRGQTARREFAEQARRLQEAKFLWYRKHRGRAMQWLYKTAVMVASLIQIAICLPLFLVPRRREAAREKSRRLKSRVRAAFGSSWYSADGPSRDLR